MNPHNITPEAVEALFEGHKLRPRALHPDFLVDIALARCEASREAMLSRFGWVQCWVSYLVAAGVPQDVAEFQLQRFEPPQHIGLSQTLAYAWQRLSERGDIRRPDEPAPLPN